MKKIFLIAASFLIIALSACKKSKESEPEKEYDGISLEEYVSKNYPNLSPVDASGVYVIITDEGVGEYPADKDLLYCYYKGYYLDGTPFDTLKQRPADDKLPDIGGLSLYSFVYTTTDSLFNHVPGWYKGFSQLKRGSKAIFLLPADQAYGDKGKKPIPPKAPLKFEVELIDARE